MTAQPIPFALESDEARVRAAAEQLLDALTTSDARQATGLAPSHPDGAIVDAQLEAAWPHAQVVSFDIFDTLVVRKVAAPRDVFLHLATPHPFSTFGLDAAQLAQRRMLAEREARRRAQGRIASIEVTLEEIHLVLAEMLGRPADDVPAMVEAERLVERALCVAHRHLKGWYDRARADGKEVWCVSDTYHDADFLRALLESCGYDTRGVVVVASADRRISKGDGRLLPAVAAERGCPPDVVLHIGDHPRSDAAIPAALGFAAVLHPWAASRHEDAPAQAPGDAIALGLAQIVGRTRQPALPFWWRFGFSVAGPLLAGFAVWLHERFQADGIDRAYFLLRDGELIEQVYRAMIGDRPGPRTALLESSRRAYFVPALESGRASILSQLLARENPRPAREFAERIGLDADALALAFLAAGFASPDDVVEPRDGEATARLLHFFSLPDVVAAFVARSREERALLRGYLQQEGVLDGGRVALVDIGWNGTIQKSLAACVALDGVALDAHGYYLGTLARVTEDLPAQAASGYLFDRGLPAERMQPVMHLCQLIEFICSSTRGGLRGFAHDADGRVRPRHGAAPLATAQQDAMRQLQAGALAFAGAMAEDRLVFGAQPITPDAAMRELARVIVRPTAEEAAHVGGLHHDEGLGGERTRAFAEFTPDWTPESVLQDHARAYWPTGLLFRREPAALALRTLLWLRER